MAQMGLGVGITHRVTGGWRRLTCIMQGKTSVGSTRAREGWENGCARLNTPRNGKPFKIMTYSRKVQ